MRGKDTGTTGSGEDDHDSASHQGPGAHGPGPHEPGPHEPGTSAAARERRRRRFAAGAWVCAVGAAFLLGAWSYSHADPGGQYGRPEPLAEGDVRHELDQAQQRAATRSPHPHHTDSSGENTGKGGAAGEGTDGAAGPGTPSRDTGTARTSTVRFPDGLGTAVAECRTDAATVRLLSWSPAEGYSADDVEPGPATEAGVELEPVADEADDRTVLVRCDNGRPQSAYEEEPEDSAEDSDDD